MKLHITGINGYIGKHVEKEANKRGHEVTDVSRCDAVIHLAWRGLPNYTSTIHYENVYHQVSRLKLIVDSGIRNITIAGTCLEAVPFPTHYARAKLAILEEVQKMECDLKWARLFNVWGGDGERSERLVPQLKRAIKRGDSKFSVIDGKRHFTRVETVAWWLVRLAEQNAVTGVIDCCDKLWSVAEFCEERKHNNGIQIVTDYPLPAYEPRTIRGDPTKIRQLDQNNPN